MAQSSGDDKDTASLELPTLKLPKLGRGKGARRDRKAEPSQPSQPAEPEARRAEPAGATTTDTEEPTQEIAAPRAPERESAPEPEPAPAPAPSRARSHTFTLPALPRRVAAAVTGLLAGLVGTALTLGAMAGCEAVRGVSTCGGAPGLAILIAILVLMILLGSLLLGAFRVRDAASTSFLGVGIVAVLTMLLLLDVIFSAWMFVVIPVVAVTAFVLADWVTGRFEDEPPGRRREWM